MSSAERTLAAERVRFGRAYAAERLPWFAPALFRCRIVISEAVGVAAVDRHYNVYWNPEVVDRIYAHQERERALSELAFLWVHEISHRLRQHGERAPAAGVSGEPASRRWNVACDLEINDGRWRGLRMPAAYPGQRAAAYGLEEGQLAETYYRLLPGGEDAGGCTPDEGSGVHGQARHWERGDRQQMTPLEEELMRREVARLTREAADSEIPGNWKEWAADVLGSRVNWRQRLSHRLSIALQRGRGLRTDYQFGRPNRRQSVYHPVLPPTLAGDRTANVAIVIDTSASMQAADLQRALAEVAGVVRQLDAPVTLIPCDLRAYEPVRVVADREAFRLTRLPGGSGTDMRAGLEAALALKPRPDAVLVLTDGMTDYPDRPYALPLLFGLIGGKPELCARPSPPSVPTRSSTSVRPLKRLPWRMEASEQRLTLTTRYGPATFGIAMARDGSVTITALPYTGLPDSVWKLTYGNAWESVERHFSGLAATLPYRVAAYPEVAAPGLALQPVKRPNDFVSFWRSNPEWLPVFSYDEATLNGVLHTLGQPRVHAQEPALAAHLPAYLRSLLDIASPTTTRLVYGVFGAMHVDPARDFLLQSLESEGRHVYTTEILRNLMDYHDPETLARLAAVYQAGKFGEDDLPAYLHLLSHYRDPALVPHLEEMLEDHPYEVAGLVHAFGASGLTRDAVARRLRARFDREEEDYYILDRLLRAVNKSGVPEASITLEDMNRKAALPAFVDVPPVNWPQQLESGWADLVRETPPPEALDILGNYLARPEPRLQRNALLQLKILLAEHPPAEPLPPPMEDRLAQLVGSRYDKVFVEVLNVLGRRAFPLRDRPAMLAAVLGVSIGSRYRFVVLTALRRIGTAPALRQQTRTFLEDEIRAADTPARLEQIGALLPFVEKYLGDVEDLRHRLTARSLANN